jgi:hypothetical protein
MIPPLTPQQAHLQEEYMTDRHTRNLTQAAAPHLQQGEAVEIGAFATVGTVSVRRQFLTAAVVATATAGMAIGTMRPAKRYLAVTSQRLLFFNGEATLGRPGKLLFSLPRETVAVAKSGRHLLAYRIDLAIAGQEKGLRLNLPITARPTMEQIAASLPAAGDGDAGAPRPKAPQAR